MGFNVPISHRIVAGCDIMLMPSRFEPCGLNQLFAMRYGTVPVAHATGGLRDTIQDFNPFAEGMFRCRYQCHVRAGSRDLSMAAAWALPACACNDNAPLLDLAPSHAGV